MKLRIKYVYENTDRHGNVRRYVQLKSGKRVRIREEPGTPEFLATYNTILAGQGNQPGEAPRPQSLSWLIQRYALSAEFKSLGATTQKRRLSILESISAESFGSEPPHGEKPYARLEAKHVRRIRDVKMDLPESANMRVKALRQMFRWAMDPSVALVKSDPTIGTPYLKSRNPDGFHTWTVEEIKQYENRHPVGTRPRLALDLLLYTGVRRSDVVKLGPQMERDSCLHFQETKGSAHKVKHRVVPILPPLRRSIDACPSGQLAYLITELGQPFKTGNSFSNWFKKRCVEAGLPHCSAHGLRKAGATILAERGATEHQLMAVYGWDSPKQAALYTRNANRQRLAQEGLDHWSEEHDEDKSCPLSEVMVPGGQKTREN